MFKLIEIAADEIRLDEIAVSEMLTAACRREFPFRIEGVAVDRDRIYCICVERPPDGGMPRYRLSRPEGPLATEFRVRYDAGFRTVGGFRLMDDYWILTEIMEMENPQMLQQMEVTELLDDMNRHRSERSFFYAIGGGFSSLLLMMFGLTMLYSTSYATVGERFFYAQLVWAGISLGAMAAVIVVGYRRIGNWGLPLMVTLIVLLIWASFFRRRSKGPIAGSSFRASPCAFSRRKWLKWCCRSTVRRLFPSICAIWRTGNSGKFFCGRAA